MSRHKTIKIRLTDSIALFFCQAKMWSRFGCWRKRDKFLRLFSEGSRRIDRELDLVKIMNNLRNMKVLLKKSIMDDSTRFAVEHSKK